MLVYQRVVDDSWILGWSENCKKNTLSCRAVLNVVNWVIFLGGMVGMMVFREKITEGFIWVFSKIMVPPNHQFCRVFHYKPSILGYPYFRKHPYQECNYKLLPLSQTLKINSGLWQTNRAFHSTYPNTKHRVFLQVLCNNPLRCPGLIKVEDACDVGSSVTTEVGADG